MPSALLIRALKCQDDRDQVREWIAGLEAALQEIAYGNGEPYDRMVAHKALTGGDWADARDALDAPPAGEATDE